MNHLKTTWLQLPTKSVLFKAKNLIADFIASHTKV